MTPGSDPLLNQRVGPYRIQGVLGTGGMGRVYAATHETAGTRVAIKVIAQQYAQDRELLDRFFTEAKAVNLVKHACIVAVYDLAQLADGRPYIVMELVEGTSLRKHPLASTTLPRLLGYFADVLGAIGAAHRLGIVHRDLKPDNVLVTPQGRAKVLDFGIAKLTNVGKTLAPRTATGVILGTPEYMAPEQIQGGTAEPRSDLYSVGVMLYELVTGRRPFEGRSDFEIMLAHLEQAPPSPSVLRADLPPALDRAILTALAKRPEDRFATADAMATALRAIGAPAPAPAPVSRRSLLAMVAAVLCVGIGVGLLLARRRAPAAVQATPPPAVQVVSVPEQSPLQIGPGVTLTLGGGLGFDYTAELEAQRALATTAIREPGLAMISIARVGPDGSVSLSEGKNAMETLWSSPGRTGAARRGCSVAIWLDGFGQHTVRPNDICIGTSSEPHCTLVALRTKLAATAPALAQVVGTFVYSQSTWMFLDAGNGITQLGSGCDPAR